MREQRMGARSAAGEVEARRELVALGSLEGHPLARWWPSVHGCSRDRCAPVGSTVTRPGPGPWRHGPSDLRSASDETGMAKQAAHTVARMELGVVAAWAVVVAMLLPVLAALVTAATAPGPARVAAPVVRATGAAAILALPTAVLAWRDPLELTVAGHGIWLDRVGALAVVLVAGVASIVASFAARALRGEAYATRFFALAGLLASASMLVATAARLSGLVVAWLVVSACVVGLVGLTGTPDARRAARRTRLTLAVGDVALVLAATIVAVRWGDLDSARPATAALGLDRLGGGGRAAGPAGGDDALGTGARTPVADRHRVGPDPGLGAAARRGGQRRGAAADPHLGDRRRVRRRHLPGARGRHLDPRDRNAPRPVAGRCEGSARRVHGRADGLHDDDVRARCARSGTAAPARPRAVQGGAVPRRRLRGRDRGARPAVPPARRAAADDVAHRSSGGARGAGGRGGRDRAARRGSLRHGSPASCSSGSASPRQRAPSAPRSSGASRRRGSASPRWWSPA